MFFSTKLHILYLLRRHRDSEQTADYLYLSPDGASKSLLFLHPQALDLIVPAGLFLFGIYWEVKYASSHLRYTWLGLLFFMEMKSVDPLLSQSLLHRTCPATKPFSVSFMLLHSLSLFI